MVDKMIFTYLQNKFKNSRSKYNRDNPAIIHGFSLAYVVIDSLSPVETVLTSSKISIKETERYH